MHTIVCQTSFLLCFELWFGMVGLAGGGIHYNSNTHQAYFTLGRDNLQYNTMIAPSTSLLCLEHIHAFTNCSTLLLHSMSSFMA